jgi:LmbE family N-acetylglucosaminyl deacetylase
LTDGGSGSEDRSMTTEKLKEMRHEEQRNAGKVIGLKDVFFCDYPDGRLENSVDVRREIVKIIRKVKPDVVVTWDPSVLYSAERQFINHPDHRASGQATLDAVFPLARDHMSFPELMDEGYEPHKTKTVLLMNFSNHNYCVDISNLLETKMDTIAAHTSQVPNMDELREVFTEFAADAGKACGVQYAEAFMRIDIR